MTAEHLLQECPSYSSERAETWQPAVTLQDKLYGNAENLKLPQHFSNVLMSLSEQRTLKKERKERDAYR
jgi:hypothetical protein